MLFWSTLSPITPTQRPPQSTPSIWFCSPGPPAPTVLRGPVTGSVSNMSQISHIQVWVSHLISLSLNSFIYKMEIILDGGWGASLVAQLVKNPPSMRETWAWSLGWEDLLEKGKAAHCSILAWRIPWAVWSMGSQRVGHAFTFKSPSSA